jgi:NADP-dependent 3-hydroxy acid dehydrogenase YdfG
MDLGLRDRVCVVTGASQGIGLAISARLAGEGARVLMVARTEDRLRAAAEPLGAEWLAADVTDPDCTQRIVATAVEQLGALDVLVNNAGT